VKWTSWPWLVVAAVLPPIVLLAMTLGADARVPRLRVPTIALDVDVRPVIANQELGTAPPELSTVRVDVVQPAHQLFVR